MKESKLIAELFLACVRHDREREAELNKLQYTKILKRKRKGKSFDAKWVIIR
jgi:hypothetical protein